MRGRLVIWMAVTILAACGTGEAPTDLPFYTATPQISQPIPRPELTQNPLDSLGFTGESPVIVASQGAFHVTISGDVESTSSTGSIVYNYIPGSVSVPARDKIFISIRDEQATQQIDLDFSPDLPPATYIITSPSNIAPQQVAAQYMRLSIGENGLQTTPIETYNRNVDGTFVILSRGQAMSGVFEFTAEWVTADESGTTVTRSVTISGEFTDVPYFRGGDPFENPVPIPERSTPAPAASEDQG